MSDDRAHRRSLRKDPVDFDQSEEDLWRALKEEAQISSGDEVDTSLTGTRVAPSSETGRRGRELSRRSGIVVPSAVQMTDAHASKTDSMPMPAQQRRRQRTLTGKLTSAASGVDSVTNGRGSTKELQVEVDRLLEKYSDPNCDEEGPFVNVDMSHFLADVTEVEERSGLFSSSTTALFEDDDAPEVMASGFFATLLGTQPVKETSQNQIDADLSKPQGKQSESTYIGKNASVTQSVPVVGLADDELSWYPAVEAGGKRTSSRTSARQTKRSRAEGDPTVPNYVTKVADMEKVADMQFPGPQHQSASSAVPHTSPAAPMPDNLMLDDLATQPLGNESYFYWTDAREVPQADQSNELPGTLLLFGRMAPHSAALRGGQCRQAPSCCLRVRNMERCVLILPKEGASELEVVNEISAVCQHNGIQERRIRFVDRYYAFDIPRIPHEKARWAKLKYPAKYPPFPAFPSAAFKCIAATVGSHRSLLELFLLKRKIMGPSYLQVHGITAVAGPYLSHCNVEFSVESPKHIKVSVSAGDPSKATAEMTPPPLTAVGVQLHSQLSKDGSTTEVISAAIVVYRDVNVEANIDHTAPHEVRVGVRPLSARYSLPLDLEKHCAGKGLRSVMRFGGEHALLAWVAGTLKEIDPDFLIGHNISAFTLDLLLRRFIDLRVGNWSCLGRLNLKQLPRHLQENHGGGYTSASAAVIEREVCCGRLIVDSYTLSREYFKSHNYKLRSLASQMSIRVNARGDVAGVTSGMEFEPSTTPLSSQQMSSVESLYMALYEVVLAAVLSVGVSSHLDAIPLTRRLCSLGGYLWSRTLSGHRSERIEFLLLHAFHELKFVVPEKRQFDHAGARRTYSRADTDEVAKAEEADNDGTDGAGGGKSRRAKAKYQGGMVLEPKRGLYSDYVLLLDFNSLYPSLIQEYNICFTTISRGAGDVPDLPPPENLICTACATSGTTPPCRHKCVLPKVIKSLVESRKGVKRLMQTVSDPKARARLEIRQKALKLTANSMYGCLGFEFSRFYAQPLAELVTREGRRALQNTVDLVPQIGPTLRVIYGDTDSVMIQTGVRDNIREVRAIGEEIRAKVNKRYQSLEIGIDGIFRTILLLKKKKYAALSVVDWEGDGLKYAKEVKGLDMVRRDWCPLSQKASSEVLDKVLRHKVSDDVLEDVIRYMEGVADAVRRGDTYELKEYVISKSLSKEPESYKGSSFPHAAVALRMRERKLPIRVGDLIPYVICEGGDKLPDKAFHVDEVLRSDKLRIDAEWYLATQIFPPVMRLCEHIEGFSPVQLSEAMGINVISQHYQGRSGTAAGEDEDDVDLAARESYAQMFKSTELDECYPTATPLQVSCVKCSFMLPIDPHRRVKQQVQLWANGAPQEPFALYVCSQCHASQPVNYLANCLSSLCHKVASEFYQSGGGSAAVRAIRAQSSYFRALFDVPHLPGCPRQITEAHRSYALRCRGIDNRMYTIDQSKVDQHAEATDPLLQCAESFYKRIEHMFIDVPTLFATPVQSANP